MRATLWRNSLLDKGQIIFPRVAIMPIILPIGAITSFLGGPLFLYLLFKGGKKLCLDCYESYNRFDV